MTSILDTIGSIFGGGSSTAGAATGGSTNWLQALLPTALTLAAGLFQEEPQMAYGNTEEGFNAQLAAEQAMLTQKLDAEKAMAALAAASGGGGGDTGKSASIAAAASKENTRNQLMGEIYTNRAKLAADRMAARITAKRGDPEVLQRASENIIQSLAAQAAAAESGFANSANFLANFKR